MARSPRGDADITTSPIIYRVDLSLRVQHLVRVTVTVPADVAPGARLELARWTPGSYVIRDYVHHVQQVEAVDAKGRPVTVTPDRISVWSLPDDVDGPVEVMFEIYGNDLTVRTNHIDDHHALIIPAATFPRIAGTEDRPHHVVLPAAQGERAWSLLPDGDAPDTFVADDWLHLVDSAFEVGDFPFIEFTASRRPHTFVWTGHGGSPDLERIAKDITRLVETCVDVFGGHLPITSYTFLCAGWDVGGGGLEHRDGSVLLMPVQTFQDEERYAAFQSLMCHEYFHLWNVKRITPAELVAPDLMGHTQTEMLWVAEGWTAYYDELIPARSGVWTMPRYLNKAATQIEGVMLRPAAKLQPVAQASREAWVKAYVRDENFFNAGVDYYGHGAVLAWCLDLIIRRERPLSAGLDEVMRDLWAKHGHDGAPGYTMDDVRAACERAAGIDLTSFFTQNVRGTTPAPIHELLEVIGLRVTEADRPHPHLGVRTSDSDRGVTITHVDREQPAWQGGATGGDLLVAINGGTVARGQLETVLKAYRAGETVTLQVLRGPRLLDLDVTLGEPRPTLTVTRLEAPTHDHEQAFHRWCGGDLMTLS